MPLPRRPLLVSRATLLSILLLATSVDAHPPHSIAAVSADEVLLIDWPSRRLVRVRAGAEPDLVQDFTAVGVHTEPHSVAIDPDGTIVVAETYGRRMWCVDSNGALQSHPRTTRPDDGRGSIQHVTFGPSGRMHLMRRRERDGRVEFAIERDEPDGSTTTLFHTDDPELRQLYTSSFVVDSEEAITLTLPERVVRIESGALRTLAGSDETGRRDGNGTTARFDGLGGIARAADGVYFVCDSGNGAVRRITPEGEVTTVGRRDLDGETDGRDGPLDRATFSSPYQIAFAPDGTAFVAEECFDPWRHRVRRVRNGVVETLAEFPFHPRDGGRASWGSEYFEGLSAQAKDGHSLESLTGLHPTKDWPLALWVSRDEELEAGKQSLFLRGVEFLRPDEARAIASIPRSRIFLRDLRHIDAVAMRALGSTPASLFLDGLPRLDAPTARVLVERRRDQISLRGLRELDVETARALARCEQGLRIGPEVELSVPVAKELSRWDGWGEQVVLSLDMTRLDAAVARELVRCKGWGFALDGLTELSTEIAKILGELDTPQLSLNGLRTVDLEVARVISTWERKFLILDGVESISPEAKALVEAGCEASSWRTLRASEREKTESRRRESVDSRQNASGG